MISWKKETTMSKNKAETITEFVLKYLNWLDVNNYSRKTKVNRQKYLQYFINWANMKKYTRPVDITPHSLENYKSYLYRYKKRNKEPLKFSSQQTMLVAIRAFFKWLARNNYTLYNPASELELPKIEKRLPRTVLNKEEAEKVLRQPNIGLPTGIRDRAILELFYSTGIRRAELRNLNVYDIDFGKGTVIIRQGKGKRDRVIPVGDRALKWLKRYLEEVRPTLIKRQDPDTLFLTQRGTALRLFYVTEIVRECINKANIGKKGACHVFRHTMATLMLDGGADVRYVQEMLGHASIESTQIYTHVSIKKLKEVHTKTHPAKLKKII